MQITLITGFLGAGKTTFLKRILREQGPSVRFGVIVNDLSELEVDGELIRLGHSVSEEDGTLISLYHGSISDTRRRDFGRALRQMQEAGVSHVLVETSGGSRPGEVIEELKSCGGAVLHAVACLVDARALVHDYDGGPGLLRILLENEDTGRRTTENLLAEQLQSASFVIITKVDTMDEHSLPVLIRTMQILNPQAQLLASAYGKIDFRTLLHAPPYSLPASPSRLPTSEADEIGYTVIRDARPLHPQRFYDQYRLRLGTGLFRSKGFIWLASRPDQVLLWNQAGGALGLEFLAIWRAHILETDRRLAPEEIAHLKAKLADAHPVYGDRLCEITLIGLKRDRDIFARGLDQCFCTEQEIAHWKRGGAFIDPWPRQLRKLA
ncbi:CobW family GTP-binding protein [Verrucomicrobium spinosum]|uniref:CobW family GTP-binding protein n=1 Tax=Verrucomicrobium spinosum TaxID=2736 RepID=UPI0001745DF7|nr:GTP-binding protein [Verrucomicrobium spinosum]